MQRIGKVLMREAEKSLLPRTNRREHCVTPILLYTKVDVQRDDQLATVVGRTKLTALATVVAPWRKFSTSAEFGKVPEISTHIFRYLNYTL